MGTPSLSIVITASGQYIQHIWHLLHFSRSTTGRNIRHLPVSPIAPGSGYVIHVNRSLGGFLFSFAIFSTPLLVRRRRAGMLRRLFL